MYILSFNSNSFDSEADAMKYKIMAAVALMLCVAVVICGCKNEPEDAASSSGGTYDPFEETAADDLYAYPQYTETWEYTDMAQLAYDGEDISVTLSIDNEKQPFELGFLAFVDGYCVPVTIDGKTDMMNIVSFAAKESKNVTVSFSPSSGKKGDVLSARIISIINPNYMPSFTEGNSTFGHFHSIGYSHYAEITLNSSPKSANHSSVSADTVALTDKIREQYNIDTEDFSKEQYEKYMENQKLPISERDPDMGLPGNRFWCFYDYDSMNSTNFTVSDRSQVTLNLSAMASISTNYRVTVFVNNNPVKTSDGYECAEFSAELEGYSHTELVYDFSQYDEKALVYAIAVPISEQNNKSMWEAEIKTSSFVMFFE